MSRKSVLSMLVACALVAPAFSFAQDKPESKDSAPKSDKSDRGRGGDTQGRRGNWDPAAMRDRISNFMREQLGADEDEWKVISPKLENLTTLQRDMHGGGFFGGRTRGGSDRGPGGDKTGDKNADAPQQSAVAKASQELRAALESKDTPAETITSKLTALREAREKAKGELQTAQKELKEVLTARQEAILVNMSILD